MTDTFKAISYSRVSTQKQADDGFGRHLQQVQIETFAKESGYRIQKRFWDVASGMGGDSIATRSDLQKALELARKTGWPIIIADVDRLGRDEASVIDLLTNDPTITIVSASDGKDASAAILKGKAMRAQKQGAHIGKMTKAALKERKRNGKKLGNPKLKEAQKRAAEANRARGEKHILEIAPAVRSLRTSGMTTASEIASGLNGRGYRTPRGGMWKAENIRRTLKEVEKLEIQSQPGDETHMDNPLWGMF